MAFLFGLDAMTIATLSLSFQSVSFAFIILGVWFAAVKRNYARHKLAMRWATGLSVISLVIAMSGSFISFLTVQSLSQMLPIVLIHHSIGLAALVMALSVTVKGCNWVDIHILKRKFMFVLVSLWTSAFLIGLGIYAMLYVI